MSTINVMVKDQTIAGKVLNAVMISLILVNKQASLADIIKARVYAEVKKFNDEKSKIFNGLVQPGDTEMTLNGYELKIKKQIDPEKQFQIAIEAFKKNIYFVLIDNKQVESLESLFFINKNMEISFVKLVPLIGG
jgi:hypothetical protein